MLKEEILKIVRRKQFLIVFAILFFSAIFDFLFSCKVYYGMELTQVRSASQCFVLNNYVPFIGRQFFEGLFPLIVSIAVAGIYNEEEKMGINNFIYTRMSRKKNIQLKVWGIVIVVFFMVFIPLIINFGLVMVTFPLHGHRMDECTYLALVNIQKERIFSYFEAFNPYLNIFLYLILRCIIGVAMAVLSFAVSLLKKFNNYIILFSSWLFYLVFSYILGLSNVEILSTSLFIINGYGSIWVLLGQVFVFFLVSGLIIKFGKERM